MHELRDARFASVGAHGEVGREGPDQGVVVVAGERVADVGTGHERAEAAQRLLVDEQFLEELPECLGGRVVPAPDRDLGLRVQHVPRGGEPAFVVVRIQQAGRRPAVDVGGQLPAEVDAVEEAGAECDARGREQVGGIAGHQDPPVAVSLDLPSVEREARQPGRLSQGQIHAEHPADAVPELGHGHRVVVVVLGGLFLAGVEPHELGVGRPEGELTALGSCETEVDPPTPGDVDVAVLEQGHRLGHGHQGEPLDLGVREAGERDAGQVAHPAARAVAADQVPGGHAVGPVRAAHVGGHRGVVLAQPDHLLAAVDLGAELAGAFVEDALELWLRERQCLHRGICEWVKSTCIPPHGKRPDAGRGAVLAASNRSSSPR